MLRENEPLCSASTACGERRTKAWHVGKGRKKKREEDGFTALNARVGREHHFAVENVQLHSSHVGNKQSDLYPSLFRKLAGAFLDHEMQKLLLLATVGAVSQIAEMKVHALFTRPIFDSSKMGTF